MTYWNGSAWEAERPADPQCRRRARRFLGATTEAGLITLLMFGLIAGTTLAAKGEGAKGPGKPSAGATVGLVTLDGADGTANHTERITFTVSTTATDRPFVSLQCWQGSTGVYNKSIGIFPTYLFDPWFTLDSSYWTPGASATCTARAYYYDKRGNQRDLASTEVVVAP